MSITTQVGALAGLQPLVPFTQIAGGTSGLAGYPVSFWKGTGSLGAGNSTAGLTGANFSSSASTPSGCVYHQDPPSGNAYLARLLASANTIGSVLLCDRLWDCEPSNTITTVQTITQPTLPARDALGGTAGVGVQLGMEIIAATSATAAAISVSYTNSANTPGQTGTFIDLPTAAIAAIGRFYRISLAPGDVGVQSVQSVTFPVTPWTAGTLALVAYRVIAILDLPIAGVPNQIDMISGGFSRLYNGACLWPIFIPTTNIQPTICGEYIESQG